MAALAAADVSGGGVAAGLQAARARRVVPSQADRRMRASRWRRGTTIERGCECRKGQGFLWSRRQAISWDPPTLGLCLACLLVKGLGRVGKQVLGVWASMRLCV
jgi:hypothetical protein